IQVIDRQEYARAAAENLLGGDTLYAHRGAILDRNGNPLAISVDTWDIHVNKRSWENESRAAEASEQLSAFLGIGAAELRQIVAESERYEPLILRDVDYESGRLILDAGISGVIAWPNTDRVHPEGDIAASIVGYVGQDNSGLSGLEVYYEATLQGTAGSAIYERDSTGQPIPFGRHITEAPLPGKDIVLTIDRYLQALCERSLADAVEKNEATAGTIIMMVPSTGEILALCTVPRLQFSSLNLDDPAQIELFRNRAVTDLYEPGSVMKVITTAAAIDQGVVSPGTTYVDNGETFVEGVQIRIWDYRVYGTQTMTGVLQHSINTGAVFMVDQLGARVFHQYLQAFGFGQPTGIDLDGEASGVFRTPADPGWSPVDLATQSFGQAISVTPLQMVAAVAAVINGGNLVPPPLVKAYVTGDGARQEVQTQVLGHPISEATSQTMREMLTQVVMPAERYYPGRPDLYTAGGKSGTANVYVYNGFDERDIASFVGFAPAENPEILIMVRL
ncbi:MAG: penicillin-binding protein 2, partial [Dehalococcoidia bacterium]